MVKLIIAISALVFSTNAYAQASIYEDPLPGYTKRYYAWTNFHITHGIIDGVNYEIFNGGVYKLVSTKTTYCNGTMVSDGGTQPAQEVVTIFNEQC